MHMNARFPKTVLALCLLASTTAAWGQFKKVYLPPPLRVFIPFPSAWKAMLDTLRDQTQIPVAEEDQVSGKIVTEFHDYIDGPLTDSHIAKIGDRPALRDGNWIKARYRYEVKVQLIAEKETLVTVNVDIQALKREYLGTESWVDIRSNGRLESDLLTAYGKGLFGEQFALEQPKKGFWERDPSREVDVQERMPTVAAPERPPQ